MFIITLSFLVWLDKSHLDDLDEEQAADQLQAGLTECYPIYLGNGSSVGDCQLAARE